MALLVAHSQSLIGMELSDFLVRMEFIGYSKSKYQGYLIRHFSVDCEEIGQSNTALSQQCSVCLRRWSVGSPRATDRLTNKQIC